MTQDTAIVELTRTRAYSNFVRRYHVLIDGRKVDSVKSGETKRFAVPGGTHEVRISLDLFQSKPLTLELAAGETVVLECGDAGPQTLADSLSLRGLGQSLSWALKPTEYLYVRLLDRRGGDPASPPAANSAVARPDPAAVGPTAAAPSAAQPPTGPMIFLSYRRNDSEHITGRIRDCLAARFGDEAIFRDVDSIPVGTRFRDKIEETIKAADCLVAIIGPHWMDDRESRPPGAEPAEDYVCLELESALRIALPLVPVLVEGAEMPSGERLGPSLRVLGGINAVTIPEEPYFRIGVDRLIEAIEELTAPTALAGGMRYCTGCGQPRDPGQRFCTLCGTPAKRVDPGRAR